MEALETVEELDDCCMKMFLVHCPCLRDVVTTFTIVNIYRFAVAAQKGGRQVEFVP